VTRVQHQHAFGLVYKIRRLVAIVDRTHGEVDRYMGMLQVSWNNTSFRLGISTGTIGWD
jgi:hypothetical protein